MPTPDAPGDIANVTTSEVGYGLNFLRRHGWRLLLIFLGVLVPMLVFAALADELHERKVFFFDAPILLTLHGMATPTLDRFTVLMSRLGYMWGVVPLDIGIIVWLAARRRFRNGLFFGLAVLGSAALNLVVKFHFARVRPSLWLSLAPENSFSFPSGHAMGSATLAAALILLLWPTRWRWLTVIGSSLFVVLVGLSRVYLGVHYPSDILAGWTAGTAWVVAMHQLIAHRAPAPPLIASKDT